MSYVEQTLASDEEIIMRARFNWTYSFWHVFFFILGFFPLGLFAWQQFSLGLSFEELEIGYIVAGISVFLGSLILLLHMIHLWTTEIAITTTRFIFKTGLIARDTKEVSLGNIEEINLQQSLWGRVFGYGQIILRGTGVGVIELPNIDNPIQLRKTMEDARSKRREISHAHQQSMEARQAQQAPAFDAPPPVAAESPVPQTSVPPQQAATVQAAAPDKPAGMFDVLKAAVVADKQAKAEKRRK